LPALSEQIVGGEFDYIAQRGDSLTGVGARFGVSLGSLAAKNNLPPDSRLRIGQPLRIDNRHIVPVRAADGLVINIPQLMLFYFKDGQLIRALPVALGRPDRPTPMGSFKVVIREDNPTWDVPASIQEEMRRAGQEIRSCVPPGPDNPLGKHWLGLSMSGYGIHGTNAPASIYHFQTHGCIRLHPDDIARLFDDVSVGTPGRLVYQRLLIAKVGKRIYLEVHDDVYKKTGAIQTLFEKAIAAHDLGSLVDPEFAADIIRRQEGIAREISRGTGAKIFQ